MNIVPLAGHGSARIGVAGNSADPLSKENLDAMCNTMERSMEQGAFGASLGLMYVPERYSDDKEIEAVASIVKKYKGILTVHGKALSAVSTDYDRYDRAHNVLALEEMCNLALKTEVNTEYSHLIFIGAGSFPSVDESLQLIEETGKKVPFGFDIYSTTCGASVISIAMPSWFLALPPLERSSPELLARLEAEINMTKAAIGLKYDHIFVSWCGEQFADVAGLSVVEIAAVWNCSPFQAYVRLVEGTNAQGQIILHQYSNQEIVNRLSRHPQSVYMTDAWVESHGSQNPATWEAFPKFLRYCKESLGDTLPQTIRKMSGLTADRFGIKDRGYLKKGYYADVCVFDFETIRERPEQMPQGLHHVYINGKPVIKDTILNPSQMRHAGKLLKKN